MESNAMWLELNRKFKDEALYSGKIWIDGTMFREVKQSLNQRGLKSNVVVNAETQNFELVPDGRGNQFNLLRSISAQQTLNAAGRDFILQSTIQYSGYLINAPQFSDALAAEHNSQDPMFRDTDNGLRELKKRGNERVLVENSSKRIMSIVGGAIYEGTFDFPIPIAGISIADFDYRHTGAQLSTFFAGPILATDLSKQYATKYRLAADLALSALPGDNRIYCFAIPTPDCSGQPKYGKHCTGDLDLGARRRRARLLAGNHSSQPDRVIVSGL